MPAAAPPLDQTGSAVPSSAGEIHVTSAGMSTVPVSTPAKPAKPVVPTAPAKPAEAPKPTARESMEAKLGERIKPGTGQDLTPEKPLGKVGVEGEEDTEEMSTMVDKTKGEPVKPGDPKAKVNPWKLIDEHKTRASKLESEVAELKKLVPNAEARKQEMDELDKVRTRAKELEDEIRYVNYEKSAEFKEKFDEPYRKSWEKAMGELSELTVEDQDTGTTRNFTANEMLKLVNLPLSEARRVADDLYGPLASDVMQHRKEIKNMFEARSNALLEAKTKGEERQKAQMDQTRKTYETIGKSIAETWNKVNESIPKDEKYGAYFSPVEGDQDGNQRLAKGYELADRAFKENPLDPKLSPEDRELIVKRRAVARHRIAAFGRMVHRDQLKTARIAELEAELAQFKGSEPSTGAASPGPASAPALGARQAMEEHLGKLIKRT